MAPTPQSQQTAQVPKPKVHGKSEMTTQILILEAWGQGLTFGALIILLLIVACNYRRNVLLHKLILLEMFLALFHATFIFFDDPVYGWYLSASSSLLFISYNLHNIVAYLKIRTFLQQKWARRTFLITLLLVSPYWIIEAWDNFVYFNEDIDWNIYTRPWEPLARDPWWIFTTVFLFYKIKAGYDFTVVTLFKSSPRFGIMSLCMILSIGFMLGDVIVTAASLTIAKGINPYWRLSLVFKCASDTIFLDDFKSVLDRIVQKCFGRFSNAGLDPVGVSPSNHNHHHPHHHNHHRHPASGPQSPTSVRTRRLWDPKYGNGTVEIEMEQARISGEADSVDIMMASSSEDTVIESRQSEHGNGNKNGNGNGKGNKDSRNDSASGNATAGKNSSASRHGTGDEWPLTSAEHLNDYASTDAQTMPTGGEREHDLGNAIEQISERRAGNAGSSTRTF